MITISNFKKKHQVLKVYSFSLCFLYVFTFIVLFQQRCQKTTTINGMEQVLPEIRTDGSKHISVTGEGLAIVHLQDDVSQLCFIIQGFKLLENGAGVQGVYPIIARACRCSILYL